MRRSAKQWRRLLRRERIAPKRTSGSLKHKHKPEHVADKQADLETLQTGGESGWFGVCFEDEAGGAMTLPPCYRWFPVGQVVRIPYEAPPGRRGNAIGASFWQGPEAGRFEFETYASLPKSRAKKHRKTPEQITASYGLVPEPVGPMDRGRFLEFVWRVGGRPAEAGADWKRALPWVMVLDN